MEIRASALSHVVRPFRLTLPYSVTTKCVLVLVSVTMDPLDSVGLILECRLPSLSANVEEKQIKLFPPLDRYAPSTKSSCPPAPEICLIPADSAPT